MIWTMKQGRGKWQRFRTGTMVAVHPLGAPFRQRSGGAVVNDMPGACQSRAVTEPQRDAGTAQAGTEGSPVFINCQ